MIGKEDVGGVHIKYLYHCRRQLWLYARGIRPEHLNSAVRLGEAVHDTSYTRNTPVDLGAARLDFIDGQHWVHEVKSSAKPTPADQAQGRHYCHQLARIGIDVQGAVLHYPKTCHPGSGQRAGRRVLIAPTRGNNVARSVADSLATVSPHRPYEG